MVPMGEELGLAQGAAVEFLMGSINQLEDDLVNLQKDEDEKGYRMAMLKGGCEEEPEKVLETRTVPQQKKKKKKKKTRPGKLEGGHDRRVQRLGEWNEGGETG